MNFEFNLLTGSRIWVQYNRDYTCDLFISGYITPGVCTYQQCYNVAISRVNIISNL